MFVTNEGPDHICDQRRYLFNDEIEFRNSDPLAFSKRFYVY
jgi:hypothetical protein